MPSKTIKQKLTKKQQAIFDLAKSTLEDEGDLEFDQYCAVSEGDDNGAYVQCWKWVGFAGTPLCKGGEPGCAAGCPVCDATQPAAS